MISELITDHNRVGLPGLGTFVAEVVPATFSDKGYTINPPYRRLSFHPSRSEDTLLIDFYAASNGISKEAAGLYLKQFLGEMKSVLKERKTIMLPGLGRLRATVENNFFFVPDPDLDIYPDGFALKPLSLKTISMADEVEIPFFPPMEEEMEVKGAVEVEGEGAGEAEAREISENKEETGGPVSPESIQPESTQPESTQPEQQQSEPTPHQASQPESEQLQPETGPALQPEQQPGPGEQEPQSESEQSQPETELQLQAEQPQPESEQLQPESEPAPQPEQQPGPGEQEPQSESEQSQPETELQLQAEQPQPESGQLQPETEQQPQSEISQTQPQPQPQPEQPQPQPKQETRQPQPQSPPETGPVHAPRRFRWWIPLLVLLAVAAVALLAFLTVAQVAPDFIDSILYTPEELRIINY